ncbi:MAG: hypothetical protein ACI955_002241 [Zhongshania sp.]|jgi:hypothetical protein
MMTAGEVAFVKTTYFIAALPAPFGEMPALMAVSLKIARPCN